MNSNILSLISFLLFFLPVVKSVATEVSHGKPNIIIVLTDDMGYGEISCYNTQSVKTPNIDRLAKEGVRFTDFYVPTPYCAPSRATLLTGRFPLRHKLIKNPAPDAGINDIGISASELTIGEYLQDAGYHTKCIGKWHLGHKPEFFPVNHGFDEYYGILYSNDMRPVQIIENRDTVEHTVDQRLLTKKYTEKAIEFIENNQQTPFFLYLAHAMPHKPLAASEQFYSQGDAKVLYNAAISELDWSTGKIMAKLSQLGIIDNTIIIFMSDNGPWYGGNAGGLKGMKATSWEGGTRVPFIIRYPVAFPNNSIVTTPCWSPDVLPTLMNLAGVKTDSKKKLDGNDISQIIKGNSKKHSPVFTMRGNRIMTIRDGVWKLFLNKPNFYKEVDLSNWKDKRAPEGITIIAPLEQATPADYPGIKPDHIAGEWLLFNLDNDREEKINVSENNMKRVSKMRKKYERFLKTFD